MTEATTQDDPRALFSRSTTIAASAIDRVTDEDHRRSTPCAEFDVEDLTRHLISVLHRAIAIGQRQPAESVPLDAPGVSTGDWSDAWRAASETQREVWSDDTLLGTEMVLPFATLPGAAALAIYQAEILVHAWDLATAIDADVAWDQDLAEVAYQTISFGIPAEGRGPEMPFDPVVPTPEGAPAMDRLVAWVGRHPGGELG